MSRKYSDNKYDKPEVDARVEMQTVKALERMGVTGITQELADQSKKEKKSTAAAKQPSNSPSNMADLLGMLGEGNAPAETKKPKNVLGMDFDIPDELSQILAAEIARQQKESQSW